MNGINIFLNKNGAIKTTNRETKLGEKPEKEAQSLSSHSCSEHS
jgi:hypothetical protein